MGVIATAHLSLFLVYIKDSYYEKSVYYIYTCIDSLLEDKNINVNLYFNLFLFGLLGGRTENVRSHVFHRHL